jgi:hypothetical protein
MKRTYIKEIYKVTEREGCGSDPPKEYYVVFKERRIHSWKNFFLNSEGVPMVIPKDTVTPYPVLVMKTEQGWEYVLPESAR